MSMFRIVISIWAALVVLALVSTGTAAAVTGKPDSTVRINTSTLGIPLVVPAACFPELVFADGAVTYDGVVKYWNAETWQEIKTHWSGQTSAGGFTYTLRGDLFRADYQGSENFGAGTFTITRSDGARMRGEVQWLYYTLEPLVYSLAWGKTRC